jgi:hypothetical protein
MVVLEIVLFLLACITILYLPGRFTLRRFDIAPSDNWITLLLSFSVGVSQYLVAWYLLSWIGLEKLYYILAFIVSIIEIRGVLKKRKKLQRPTVYTCVLITSLIFSAACMSYVMIRSGVYDAGGSLLFYGVNSVDAIWHITLIENLTDNFPPTHPGIASIPLRGYNFFYDLLLASFQKFYPFGVMDLYFRYFAITLSLFFGIATIAFARFVKMGKVGTILFLLLSFFAQGFGGYILTLLNVTYHSPIVQSIAHAVDPNVLFSMILFFAGYILLFNKKPNVLVVMVFAILPMVKIYTAILAFAGLGIIAAVALLKEKNLRYIFIFFLSCVVAAMLYLPINFGAGSLIFTPFLLYKHYMESGAVIPSYQWILKYQTYHEHGNILRIIQLYGIAMLLFFIPSLGIRLITIFSIKELFSKKFYTIPHIYLMAVIITVIVIPTLFIQSVAVFVVVQFFWIVYLLLLVPTAFTMERIIGKVTVLKVLIISIVLLVICLPETMATIKIYSRDPLVIHADLIKTISSIPTDSNSASTLVINDTFVSKNHHNGVNVIPIVSAVSGISSYYEPEVLEFLQGESLTRYRRAKLMEIIEELPGCSKKEVDKLLSETKASHILTYQEYSCLNTLPSVRKIHTSGVYSLYEVIAE